MDTGIAAHFDWLILLWKQHRYEPIPHLHLENKTKLELTEDMTCQQLLAWMELNLCPAPI